MLKLEVARSSKTSVAQTVLTRSKTPKQNQHEHFITVKHTVSKMLLVSLVGCGLADIHRISFVFDSKAMQHPSKPTEYENPKCH